MKRTFQLLIALVIVFGLSAHANATLILRGQGTSVHGTYNLIYDTDFDITWYDYTNAANTWQNQVNWAAALTVDFGDAVYNDWSLPTALNQDGTGPCSGICTGSEMGHLYSMELGNVAYPLSNTGDFQNLLDGVYWTGTASTVNPAYAWEFYYASVYQDLTFGGVNYYALAVRPGDVSAVPEPGTMLLLGSGLVGLAAFRKRFKS